MVSYEDIVLIEQNFSPYRAIMIVGLILIASMPPYKYSFGNFGFEIYFIVDLFLLYIHTLIC